MNKNCLKTNCFPWTKVEYTSTKSNSYITILIKDDNNNYTKENTHNLKNLYKLKTQVKKSHVIYFWLKIITWNGEAFPCPHKI
jgi:hypothetical protein